MGRISFTYLEFTWQAPQLYSLEPQAQIPQRPNQTFQISEKLLQTFSNSDEKIGIKKFNKNIINYFFKLYAWAWRLKLDNCYLDNNCSFHHCFSFLSTCLPDAFVWFGTLILICWLKTKTTRKILILYLFSECYRIKILIWRIYCKVDKPFS